MSKLSVSCEAWRPLRRKTLAGFARVYVAELALSINDVAVHTKGERRWAALPSKPWIKDGAAVTGDDGKIVYSPIFEFARAEVRDAFSRAVIDAVRRFEPKALGDTADVA